MEPARGGGSRRGGGGGTGTEGAGFLVSLLWLGHGVLQPEFAELGATVDAALRGALDVWGAVVKRRRMGTSKCVASSGPFYCTFPELFYHQEISYGSGPRLRYGLVSAPGGAPAAGCIAVGGRGGERPEEGPHGTFRPSPLPPPRLEERRGRRPKSPVAASPQGEAGCPSPASS